jgi:hypothetical protein
MATTLLTPALLPSRPDRLRAALTSNEVLYDIKAACARGPLRAARFARRARRPNTGATSSRNATPGNQLDGAP